MAEQVFRGRTEDAAAPFIGAGFWNKGKTLAGFVEGTFDVEGRLCYRLRSLKPIEVDGDDTERVSLDTTAGFRMALQAAGISALKEGDKLFMECTGQTPAKKEGHSPRTNFKVEVTRDVDAF